MPVHTRLKIAIVGTGISGLSAAWLLSQQHDVTIYERADRIGGHSNTILASVGGRTIPIDTGFIVFNRKTYPNLTALFEHLKVPVQVSNMSFGVSLDGGALEYSGSGLSGLFGQKRNLFRRRFWSMLADISRFYRDAPLDPRLRVDESISLGDYLASEGYSAEFRDDHLLPMAGAIWSATPVEMMTFPAAAFVRFYDNHGLLQLRDRPPWETVVGGSRVYVDRLTSAFAGRIRLDTAVSSIRRTVQGVVITDSNGDSEGYDHAVLAAHADQTLQSLVDPSPAERELLGAFRYSRNLAVLHTDEGFMPKRRSVWSSWNYIGDRDSAGRSVCVTYWMNCLQNIESDTPLFVTLNPPRAPRAGSLLHSEVYEHPMFGRNAIAAQRKLWSLQGNRNTWYCGAYFGSGFHEDGLQSGLAVAEQLGGIRRPWRVPYESGRIVLNSPAGLSSASELQR
ncbi:MAG: FAD-dependent oxidoreductase [Alphaproteobacteria bacterium]|nr:FAD-dependent oxidoreductase [Alphaproteobacteria bacterium]